MRPKSDRNERRTKKRAVLDINRKAARIGSEEGRIEVALKEKSMRKIKEILRLHFEQGLGQRQIARSFNTSQSTLHDYLAHENRLPKLVARQRLG